MNKSNMENIIKGIRQYYPVSDSSLEVLFSYMKKMEAGEGARDTLSFCVCYFGEFLQVMAEEERWDDIIRIGSYIKNARNFSDAFSTASEFMSSVMVTCRTAFVASVGE